MAESKSCGCPEVDVEEWDLMEHFWKEKFFYKKTIPLVNHIPLGIENKIRDVLGEVKDKGYVFNNSRHMLLQKDALFIGHLLVEIENPQHTDKNISVIRNGKFLSKIHTGSRSRISKSVNKLDDFAKSHGRVIRDKFFWYGSCSRCVEDRSKHVTVVFGRFG